MVSCSTYSPETVHRIAKRNALLRRGLYPGSPKWTPELFADRRDGSEVPDADLRRILAQPLRYELYVPYSADCRLIHGLPYTWTPPTAREFIGRGLVHHVNKINQAYGTLISGTGGINSLASSSTWLAGYEWFLIDNTLAADAGFQLDWFVSGQVMVGTTPTITTEIRLGLVGSPDGTFWPDVFDGTPSAETITSAGVASGFLKYPVGGILGVDATTTDRAYPFAFAVRDGFRGVVPKQSVIFVSHNTGVALNATAGNQKYFASPEFVTST